MPVTDADWTRDVDIERPSAARIYDYYLGGSHNFAVDRQAAEQVVQAIPNVRQIATADPEVGLDNTNSSGL